MYLQEKTVRCALVVGSTVALATDAALHGASIMPRGATATRVFHNLFLLRWGPYFVRQALWPTMPVGGVWQKQLVGKVCLFDGHVENHEHVLRHCFFSPFVFDRVCRALDWCSLEIRQLHLSTLFRMNCRL